MTLQNANVTNNSKFPIDEHLFLTDQRSVRITYISGVDIVASKTQKHRITTRDQNVARIEKHLSSESLVKQSPKGVECEQSDSDSDDDVPLSEIRARLKATVSTEHCKGPRS